MKEIMKSMVMKLLQLLIIASVFAMFSFVFADDLIELEYGNEAYEEFMSYKLESGYDYQVSDDKILRIEDHVLYANRFGDAKLIVSDLNGNFIRETEVIVYFVGNELTPFSPATINKPYLSGYPDGTFKPKNFMTRGELSVILCELMPMELKVGNSYIDLHDDHWARDYLLKAADYGFISETSEEEISPDAYITKEMMAQVIYRYSDYMMLDLLTDKVDLVDTENVMVYHAINSGAMMVFTDQFEPESFLKREEVVKIINYMSSRKIQTSGQYFTDVDFTNPLYLHIQASAK
ncbi:S-layer homology domain-containing protein [Acidaminobacter sp. JC074]|uniref:S-layer homology domain-containing protein n=1 Tax=Acidaminobacter sp. JC074 TaxID=2530199 RepID=UPI001F0E194A|nr:S-layer homology domain-containing protein [Acidaminobacter sp. JC074]MCH4887143.1 S-layer homology domain-containing protein [Acidaminobacter sp. JC074]